MKVKRAKPPVETKTSGTRRAGQLRARCNELSDPERRALMDEAMRLFYGTENGPGLLIG